MKEVLEALRGARLIGELVEGDLRIRHYLLPDGRIVEVVARRSRADITA